MIFNPETIEDRRLVAPGDVSDLMPTDSLYPDGSIETRWMDLAGRMMAGDANALSLSPVVGTDPTRAFRHIRAIVKGTEPSVAERTVAVAYLLSLWYSDYTLPETVSGGWNGE